MQTDCQIVQFLSGSTLFAQTCLSENFGSIWHAHKKQDWLTSPDSGPELPPFVCWSFSLRRNSSISWRRANTSPSLKTSSHTRTLAIQNVMLKCFQNIIGKLGLICYLCKTKHSQLIYFLHKKKHDIVRIFHGCEVRIEKSFWGSLFGITRLCQVMPNSDSEGQIFLSAPNNHDRFFF